MARLNPRRPALYPRQTAQVVIRSFKGAGTDGSQCVVTLATGHLDEVQELKQGGAQMAGARTCTPGLGARVRTRAAFWPPPGCSGHLMGRRPSCTHAGAGSDGSGGPLVLIEGPVLGEGAFSRVVQVRKLAALHTQLKLAGHWQRVQLKGGGGALCTRQRHATPRAWMRPEASRAWMRPEAGGLAHARRSRRSPRGGSWR